MTSLVGPAVCFYSVTTSQCITRYLGQLHKSPALSVCPWVPELVSLRPETFQVDLARKLALLPQQAEECTVQCWREEPVIVA